MKPAIDILEDRISSAMAAVTGRKGCAAIVRPATDPKFGDYQANGVMALAKHIKTNPRELAEAVVEKLQLDDICEPSEVAGPGFINLRLRTEFITERLLEINNSEKRLGIDEIAEPKTIVVDFSGPNIAKQMHVGHLRSTIIGDCICRTLEFLGHKVISQNHIGDWGLQIGMVICALQDAEWEEGTSELSLEVLERHYKRIAELEAQDTEVARKVREWTTRLHGEESGVMVFWREARRITLTECFRIYEVLDTLRAKDIWGESEYRANLPIVVRELKNRNLAVESDGAVCVFPEGFRNKEGEPLPFIIQKSDGAYLYATTDLAAIRYRIDQLKANTIIYVTDSRQKLHFEMLFATARMAKWAGDDIELSHVMFGSVLGENGTPLKTRSGENVKLKELLDEAVERAKAVVEDKNPDLPTERKDEIAKAVGIGAVKYADYSNNRTSDYIFSFDKMLAMDGNTAPYMQYAYARIRSIGRKAKDRGIDVEAELADVRPNLTEADELGLGKHLLRYGEAIESAAADYRPNYLTAYLYELAQKFSGLYTNCPVLAASPDRRPTRLLLCNLTAKTIKHGLGELLGIEVVEQM
jgi:arginyl-tRNA synthetase